MSTSRGRLALAAGAVTLAMLAAGCGGGPAGPAGDPAATANGAAATVVPLHYRGVTPTHKLHPHTPISVTFSAPLASTTATPTIHPAIAGTWQVAGDTVTFTPTRDYAPETTYTVTVPAGMVGAGAGRLRKAHTVTLTSPTPGVGFAEQILARLHYLPLKTTAARPATQAAEADAVYDPPAGRYTWRYSATPTALRDIWAANKPNSLLQGALLAFQHLAGVIPDELLGPDTWKALLVADAARRHDPNAYSYIYADLASRPQTLTVWRAGQTVVTSPVNGGVPGALTPDGTFPIYERLISTTMSGTNPDGSHYSDPGVPWVNYFSGGSAVHGFPRASYGSPQSVGCLELPIPTAETVFGLVNYGTLVTVTGQ